jgi:hypothetical protein
MEQDNFSGAGTGAATQPGSRSELDFQHRWIIKNVTNSNSLLFFLFTSITIYIIKISSKHSPNPEVCLVYGRVGAAASGAASKFIPGTRAA